MATNETPAAGSDTSEEAAGPGSIIDTILELDQLLSADVRRAEEIFRLFRRGDLLAVITDLEDQLAAITDDLGRPTSDDDSLADSGQARSLALKIQETRKAYYAASGNVRLVQIDPEEWEAFKTTWKGELDQPEGPGLRFWDGLVAATLAQPKVSAAQVIKMRQLYGAPQIDRLGAACWAINTQGGALGLGSSRSTLVLERLRRSVD